MVGTGSAAERSSQRLLLLLLPRTDRFKLTEKSRKRCDYDRGTLINHSDTSLLGNISLAISMECRFVEFLDCVYISIDRYI